MTEHTPKALLTPAEAESLSPAEIFAKTKERLGLAANASAATVLATVDGMKRTAVRNRVCDKVGVSRGADDDTLYDAVYAAITKLPTSRAAGTNGTTANGPAALRDGAAFALNPLLHESRGDGRTPGNGSAPTLFPSGDLPAFTASGNDPQALLRLPACVRHAAAKADATEWARLFNNYATGDPDDDIGALTDPASADVGNLEYQDRFSAWRRGEAI